MNWPLFLLGLYLACTAIFLHLCHNAPVMPAWMDQ